MNTSAIKFNYDETVDALYIYFLEPIDFKFTIPLLLTDSKIMFNIDINKFNQIMGIEIIDAESSTDFKRVNLPQIHIANEETKIFFTNKLDNASQEIDLNEAVRENTNLDEIINFKLNIYLNNSQNKIQGFIISSIK